MEALESHPQAAKVKAKGPFGRRAQRVLLRAVRGSAGSETYDALVDKWTSHFHSRVFILMSVTDTSFFGVLFCFVFFSPLSTF